MNAIRKRKTNISKWSSPYGTILTERSDPNFKIAKILINNDKTKLLYDVRIFNKGTATKMGVSLDLPEFIWFKECLDKNKPKAMLEHGNREISYSLENDSINIKVMKRNGVINNICLFLEEFTNLKASMKEIHDVIIEKAKECGLETGFGDYDYIKETI